MNRSLRKAQVRQLQIVSNKGRLRRRLFIHTYAPQQLGVCISEKSAAYKALHIYALRHRYKAEGQ